MSLWRWIGDAREDRTVASRLLGGALEVGKPGPEGTVQGLLQGRGLGAHDLAVPRLLGVDEHAVVGWGELPHVDRGDALRGT
jgi:hypothetical protein